MTGKLADTVMAVRNGQQIARKYQPVVYNPSTPAQVAQRAKLKLLSQLSAVMAPVIAMPRRGSVSARNLFTKMNFRNTTFSDGEANITLPDVQLTSSVVAMTPVTANVSGSNVEVSVGAGLNVDRVVYCLFYEQQDKTLRFAGSKVISEAGADNTYNTTFPATAENGVVLAYGVRDNTEAARVMFGNMEVVTAGALAQIVTSRKLTETDITLTETRGAAF